MVKCFYIGKWKLVQKNSKEHLHILHVRTHFHKSSVLTVEQHKAILLSGSNSGFICGFLHEAQQYLPIPPVTLATCQLFFFPFCGFQQWLLGQHLDICKANIYLA